MGPVTMASTSPESASATAVSIAFPAARPGSGSLLVTMRTSAASGCARAFSTPSGPMPRGSPRVTARRGRAADREPTDLETDVYVRLLTQLIDVVLDGQIVGEDFLDAHLHVVEGQLALGMALRDVEHHKLGSGRAGTDGNDRLQTRGGVLRQQVLVLLRHARDGHGLRQLGLLGTGGAPGQRG